MQNTLRIAVLGLLFFINLPGQSQEKSENTLKFLANAVSPNATLQQVAWIQGHWHGEAFGGLTEEIWSPPNGDSMMFVFRLLVDNKVQFYEIGGIRQIGETLLLQLKHFNGDFTGWEEKDETVDFKLVKIDSTKVYFDQFTFEKISDQEMNVYVVISEKEGLEKEVKFNYKK